MQEYELIAEKNLPDLASEGRIYRHRRSGARVFTIKNDDPNRVFAIAFRTPPENSTGVAHITEHSVLCGSEKYPLKDPFVELAKGSLNTFLNAMTYPDKTVYPIASTNKQDFENLMDVYMDAVFHPNSNENPKILMQEGWHYELPSLKDQLTLNGVVYNEMKGVYSNPSEALDSYILRTLYPHTAYGFESGGDPDVIPELSFEEFRAFHRRFYHPSNCYIILYGDLDFEERLHYLDREYLSKYTAIDPRSDLMPEKEFTKPVRKEFSYSIGENDPLEHRTYLSYDLSLGEVRDPKMKLAFDVLDYALLGAPGAVLKKALTDAGIGEDILGGYTEEVLEPYFSITAKNADEKDADRFRKVIIEALEKAADEGLDRKTLLSAINHDEFTYREADYDRTPKGLIYALTALDSWLYGKEPWTCLENERYYDELRKDTEKGFFENLIRRYLLGNNHAALIILKPEINLTERKNKELADKLDSYKKSLSSQELKRLVKETKELKAYQSEKTSEEDLRKLPLLSRSDIDPKATTCPYQMKQIEGTNLLETVLPTRGILYLQLGFNTAGLTEEELSYAAFLKTALAYMDTKSYSYQDLASEIYLHTGGIGFDMTAYPDLKKENYYTGMFAVNVKFLYRETENAGALVSEILHTTKFNDRKRMSEILKEASSEEQMRAESMLHMYAVNRAGAYIDAASRYQDVSDGLSYARFIKKQAEAFDKDPDTFISKVSAVAKKLFRAENLFAALAGEKDGIRQFEEYFPTFRGAYLKAAREEDLLNRILKPETGTEEQDKAQLVLSGNLDEGFRTPSLVNYAARVGRFNRKKHPYTGALLVLRIILNYEYLWLNLRVKGGAYGCMSGFGRTGLGYLVSYRDPHLKETLAIYEQIPQYLRTFSTSDRDMTKYVIGAISELDRPKTCSAKFFQTVAAFFTGVTDSMRQKERDQVLSASEADIRALAEYVQDILDMEAGCTIGNAAMIDDAKDEFLTIGDLF